jgi:hypothetical protein
MRLFSLFQKLKQEMACCKRLCKRQYHLDGNTDKTPTTTNNIIHSWSLDIQWLDSQSDITFLQTSCKLKLLLPKPLIEMICTYLRCTRFDLRNEYYKRATNDH